MRISIPYLQGAYLAFNAIPDVYFVGDGPSCIFDKGAHIHGRHDLFSTLLSCEGAHRIQHTGVNVFNMAGNTEGAIARALRKVAAAPGCGAVVLGSMPMCAIAGTDYERVLREALEGTSRPAFLMPRRSAIAGDWLDGYSDVLKALAEGMDLAGSAPSADRVGLVGYFMDRNEGEHWGNLKELSRLLRALDLEPVSIWLSGSPYEDLRAVRRAGTIVSLPHGRAAARVLARRLGARLVEAELPFGLEASRRFVETVAASCGRTAKGAALIERELGEVVPRLQWTVPHAFLRRRFAFAGDPHHAACFAEQIEGLGGRMAGTMVLGGARHLDERRRRELEARPGTVFEPLPAEVRRTWSGFCSGEADLVVAGGFPFQVIEDGPRRMEFGFPSEATHFLKDEPYLGFQGALGFLGRAANEVVRGLRAS